MVPEHGTSDVKVASSNPKSRTDKKERDQYLTLKPNCLVKVARVSITDGLRSESGWPDLDWLHVGVNVTDMLGT